MSDLNAARRWAKALVDLAIEAGGEDAAIASVEAIGQAMEDEGGELLNAMSNPSFGIEERKAVILEVAKRVQAPALVTQFLGLLADRSRLNIIPDVAAIARTHLDERAGRVRVVVSTVEPLTPQLEAELTAAFAKATGKTVILDSKIDPFLIGGIVARVGSRVFDASVRTRLDDLKNRLIHA